MAAFTEDAQLTELIEAVAAVERQDPTWPHSTAETNLIDTANITPSIEASQYQTREDDKRARAAWASLKDSDKLLRKEGLIPSSTGKRRRSIETTEASTDASETEGSEDAAQQPSSVQRRRRSSDLARKASKASGVAGRPQKSTLLSSLQVSTEDTIRLQAAAKAYMLDRNHPERREAVAQKGKIAPEIVKIRMLQCARNFLDEEGYGEQFFGRGRQSGDSKPRNHFWPDDRDHIIQLIIPLLRRVVTNERQRQYANETRREEKKQRAKSDSAGLQYNRSASPPWASQSSLPKPIGDSFLEQLQQSQTNDPQVPLLQPQNVYHGLQQTQGGGPSFGDTYDLLLSDSVAQSQSFQPLSFNPQEWTSRTIPDIFGDGKIPSAEEAAIHYTEYNNYSNARLDQLHSDTTLSDPEWFDIIAALDGHFRMFHDKGEQCVPACEQAHLQMIMDRYDPFKSNKSQVEIDQSMSAVRGAWAIVRQSTTSTIPTAVLPVPLAGSKVTLHVNLVMDNKRIVPRIDLPATQCPNLNSVIARARERTRCPEALRVNLSHPEGSIDGRVIVLLSSGLTPCVDDASWKMALSLAEAVEWMDNELIVLVELTRLDVEHT